MQGQSEKEHGLCACTIDNPLAKARGSSLSTGTQTMLYLSAVPQICRLFFWSCKPCICLWRELIFTRFSLLYRSIPFWTKTTGKVYAFSSISRFIIGVGTGIEGLGLGLWWNCRGPPPPPNNFRRGGGATYPLHPLLINSLPTFSFNFCVKQ